MDVLLAYGLPFGFALNIGISMLTDRSAANIEATVLLAGIQFCSTGKERAQDEGSCDPCLKSIFEGLKPY